jgi:hypothetical protein
VWNRWFFCIGEKVSIYYINILILVLVIVVHVYWKWNEYWTRIHQKYKETKGIKQTQEMFDLPNKIFVFLKKYGPMLCFQENRPSLKLKLIQGANNANCFKRRRSHISRIFFFFFFLNSFRRCRLLAMRPHIGCLLMSFRRQLFRKSKLIMWWMRFDFNVFCTFLLYFSLVIDFL